MRVIVVSNTPWAIDNSFGSSYSNIFGGLPGLEFANVYCRAGAPNNDLVSAYFQITEKSLLQNLVRPSVPSGRTFAASAKEPTLDPRTSELGATKDGPLLITKNERKGLDLARKRRLQVFFWARDLIWAVGRWRSRELRQFIADFKPDLVFQPIYYSSYLSALALYVQDWAQVPMVGYVSDDVYTLRQFSLSPLYWIDRLIKRRRVRRVIDRCEYLYVISEVQRIEYDRIFGKDCRVLAKCADFSLAVANLEQSSCPTCGTEGVSLVFTGNVGAGRWRTLSLVVDALEEMRSYGLAARLTTYTGTPVTPGMRRALERDGVSSVHRLIPAEEVSRVQSEADILVHVEGLDLRSRRQVHQSFSTKIVDYLAQARAIFAVGPADAASIQHLRENDAAVVVSDAKQIPVRLAEIVADDSLRAAYAARAVECVRRHHDCRTVQGRLLLELQEVVHRGAVQS